MTGRGRAVVVGSGPNGLAAAVTLAEHGVPVTVLEGRPSLGGAVATAELTLPGFRHDVYSAVYPAAVASPVFARWPLADHGLRWVHPDLPMAHPTVDGRAGVLSRDLDETVASLDGMSPGDGGRWAEFITPYVRHFPALRGVMMAGFPPVAGASRLAVALRLGGLLEFARLLLMPAMGLTGELFSSPASAAWLHGAALHGDVPPDASGSAIAAMYLQVMGHTVGWPSPAGGAHALPRALVAHLKTLGGEARVDARVRSVVVERGRVAGVELDSGERIAASAVVADVSVAGLLRLAGDAFPASATARYRRFRPGPATLKLDWALSAPVPWSAPDARRAGTVHVGAAGEELAESVTELALGRWPRQPFLLAGQQSVFDPDRAPNGNHTAWAYTHVPRNGSAAEQEEQVARVEAQMERFAPGFSRLVLGRHVAGPADLEADNPNLVGGDVGGGSYTLDQVVFRPVPSLSPYRTPVKGLYIGSASAFPGGAVHGVPGRAAARVALADRRLRRVPLA